jgi:hypothetical protein
MNPASYQGRPPRRVSAYVVVRLAGGTYAAVHRAGWMAHGTYVSSHNSVAMAAATRDRLNAKAHPPTGPLDPATGDQRDTSVDYAREAWG